MHQSVVDRLMKLANSGSGAGVGEISSAIHAETRSLGCDQVAMIGRISDQGRRDAVFVDAALVHCVVRSTTARRRCEAFATKVRPEHVPVQKHSGASLRRRTQSRYQTPVANHSRTLDPRH
nr:hypothetical protein CFP56_31483 [Quercus suber]